MKRFRFSLLSLVVGVVLAGGVLWLNVREGPEVSLSSVDEHIVPFLHGWPYVAYYKPFPYVHPDKGHVFRQDYIWNWDHLATNIAIAGLLVCEFALRRWGKKAET